MGGGSCVGTLLYLYLILSFKVPTISTVLSYNPKDGPALKKFVHFLLSWRHFGMAFLEPTPPTLKETVWPVGLTVVLVPLQRSWLVSHQPLLFFNYLI
jgi:hypothetical protein